MGKTAMMQSLQVVFLITRNDMCRRLTNYYMMVYLLQMYVNNIQNERKQQKNMHNKSEIIDISVISAKSTEQI